jgi:RNA polymerase sigma-70 factor, ECF subfamily
MTGSVIDGEDAVQDTLLKALQSFPGFQALDDPQAWLFRVAHNASIDVLRQRTRGPVPMDLDEMSDLEGHDSPADRRWVANMALRSFMQLAPSQRSCVLLMDVLEYSLSEVCTIIGRSLPSVKAALHRGRERLRQAGTETTPHPLQMLSAPERRLLEQYADRFNARDFDAVREMLAEEVKLDLVARHQMSGKAEVADYVHNYAGTHDWRLKVGFVDGRPAILAFDPQTTSGRAIYFVLVEFADGQVTDIRDFRYARYATIGAEFATAATEP